MPTCLAVSRLYYCSEGTLSVDPSVECWSGAHLIVASLCLVMTLPLFIGFPLLCYDFISDSVVYKAEFDHEKRLQAWEMEFVFRLGDYFQRSQLWLCSSFRRHSAYFSIFLHCLKAYTLLLFLLCRFSIHFQAALFWLGTFVSLVYVLYCLPYRLHSTNVELCAVSSLLFVNATFGVFNAFGVKNAVLVASTQTIFLLSLHACGLLILVALIMFGLCTPANWPAQRTIKRLRNSSLWPSVVLWIETIREAQAVDLDCYKCLPEAVDILALEESLRSLRRDWLAASSVGSVFTVIIRENLEQLLMTHSTFLPFALRRHEYLDKVWVDGGGEAFRRRAHTYRLTNPKKRSIITKLFAMKAFIGDRVINREVIETDGRESDYGDTALPLIDEYGMDMNKHRKLSALLLGDEESQSIVPDRHRPHGQGQGRRGSRLLEDRMWNSEDAYRERREELSRLSNQTEDFLQKYKSRSLLVSVMTSQEIEVLTGQFSDLYRRWDDIIEPFERRELSGGGFFTALDEEEWLTYRFTLEDKWKDFDLRIAEVKYLQEKSRYDERSELGSEISESKGKEAISQGEEEREGRGSGKEREDVEEREPEEEEGDVERSELDEERQFVDTEEGAKEEGEGVP